LEKTMADVKETHCVDASHQIECPCCGEMITELYEVDGSPEDTVNMDCPFCNRELLLTTHVAYTYDCVAKGAT
jgi:hypothetical protein